MKFLLNIAIAIVTLTLNHMETSKIDKKFQTLSSGQCLTFTAAPLQPCRSAGTAFSRVTEKRVEFYDI